MRALMRVLTRALLSLSLCLPAAALAQGVSAFTNVTLIDGRGGPAMPDMTVNGPTCSDFPAIWMRCSTPA